MVAERVGPAGRVVGIDLNPAMIHKAPMDSRRDTDKLDFIAYSYIL